MQAKAVELFELACLQSAIVFGLDDEPIPRVDAPSNAPSAAGTRTSSASIVLNLLARLTANKQKHKQTGNADSNHALNNFMLLANSFKESIAVLAQALLTQNPTELLSTRTSEAFPPATTSFLDDRISKMESRLTEVQNTMSSRLIEIQKNMETRLGDVTGLLGRTLAAVSTDGNQARDEAQAGRAQAAGGGQATSGG